MHDVASRSFSRAKAEEPDQFLIRLGTGSSFLRGGKYKGKCLRALDLEAIRPNVNSSFSLNVKVTYEADLWPRNHPQGFIRTSGGEIPSVLEGEDVEGGAGA